MWRADLDAEADERPPKKQGGAAAQVMLDNKYGCLPVVEGGRVEGILTESDFVRYLADRE